MRFGKTVITIRHDAGFLQRGARRISSSRTAHPVSQRAATEKRQRMTITKITYATMSGDQMDELHRELDRAIEDVRGLFGRSYPLVIDGRDVRAAAEFEDRSPIDTRLLLGRFQSASREQVREAIAAARAAFPAWSGRPWSTRVTMLKKVADAIRARRLFHNVAQADLAAVPLPPSRKLSVTTTSPSTRPSNSPLFSTSSNPDCRHSPASRSAP